MKTINTLYIYTIFIFGDKHPYYPLDLHLCMYLFKQVFTKNLQIPIWDV